jgi:hypothetical protein
MPSDMSLAAGAGAISQVNVNPAGITTASTFTTSITLNAFEPQTGKATMGSPITVPITVNVAPLTLQLSATSLVFTTAPGSVPPPQAIDVTNTGGDPLTWTIDQPPQAWLTVNPLASNYAPGETSSITFSVDATGLSSGIYYANAAITPVPGVVSLVTIKLVVA